MPKDLLAGQPKDLLGSKAAPQSTAKSPSIGSRLKSAGAQAVDNLLDPATEPLGGLKGRALGSLLNPAGSLQTLLPSVALSAAGIPEEDIAPFASGTAGALIGGRLGKPNLGLGIGVAAGNTFQQAAKKLRGTGDDISVQDALIIGGVAAAGGKVFEGAFRAAGVATRIIPERARAKLFDKALQAVNVGRKQLSRNWNSAVTKLIKDNPDKRVNLKPAIEKLNSIVGEFPEENLVPQLNTAVKRSPRLQAAIKDPDKAIGLTLKEAQELKNAVTSTTNAITRKATKKKTTPNERVVFDVLDSFDDSITQAFPKMAQVRQAYRQGIKEFELARPLVEPGSSVETSIFSRPQGLFGFGGTPFMKSTQGRLAFQDIVSRTEAGAKLFGVLKTAHNLNKAADAVGRLAQISVGGAVISKLLGRDVSPR